MDDSGFERVSRTLAVFARAALWVVPALWLLRAAVMIHTGEYGQVRWTSNGWLFALGSGPTLPHPWLNLATELPWLVIALGIIERFRRLALDFAASGPFGPRAPAGLRTIARWFFAAAFVPHIIFGEGSGIHVNFGFEALLPGAALLFVSWILARGRRLAVEQSLTI